MIAKRAGHPLFPTTAQAYPRQAIRQRTPHSPGTQGTVVGKQQLPYWQEVAARVPVSNSVEFETECYQTVDSMTSVNRWIMPSIE